MEVNKYGWDNNAVECQENVALTVGNVYVLVGLVVTSNKTIWYRKYKSDVWLTVHRNSVWIRKTN
jgi:hypothetical protein